ncbi:hypothetical protein TWF217_010731 [Orbilia oligospora]|nr:hypothetical protein TWF217_010731 [Orbilia oligospora]KAF3268198.1 hypothetical protein TWF128_008202 [Orbilia oligospora]
MAFITLVVWVRDKALIQSHMKMHTAYQTAVLDSQRPDGVDYMAMRNSLGKSSFTHRKTHAPFSERACGCGKPGLSGSWRQMLIAL